MRWKLNYMTQDINHFTHLIAWQKNHSVLLDLYGISKKFPSEELFVLVSQIRRAALSVTANLAEGYGRYHIKDRLRFYVQARGSNTELQNHIIVAHDLDYIDDSEFERLKAAIFEGYKLICGLIKSTNNMLNS